MNTGPTESISWQGQQLTLREPGQAHSQAKVQHLLHCANHHSALLKLANEYADMAARDELVVTVATAIGGEADGVDTTLFNEPESREGEEAIVHLENCAAQHPKLLRAAKKYLLHATLTNLSDDKCDEILGAVAEACRPPATIEGVALESPRRRLGLH